MSQVNLFRFTFLSIFCFALILSCQKEIKDVFPQIPDSQADDKLINTSFQGRVIDENGNPIAGAIARSADKYTITDEYGIFRLADAQTSEHFAFVSVEKSGYFKGSRTVIGKKDGINFVQIQLIKKKLAGKFIAGNATSLNLNDKATVAFPAGAIITKDGVNYSGNVSVFATTIDPSTENFLNTMPGDLRGIRIDSSITALLSYGMITVILTDDAGEELQLNKNSAATISMKIPTGLQSGAPSEIPLWHFNEKEGKWIEEGKATKQGNIYVGEVSHFSTWNYDVPQNFVFISLEVGGPKGAVAAYTQVTITNKTNGGYSGVFTDSLGQLRTWVPKNVSLEVKIVNQCNDILFEKGIGPLNEDIDLGRIEIPGNEMITVTGQVKNCDNELLPKGYVNVYAKGLYYRGEVEGGNYSIIMNQCATDGSSAEIYAVDQSGHKRGESAYIALDAGQINAGELSACEAELLEQFAYFKLGEERHDLVVTNDTISFHKWDRTTHFWYTKYPGINDAHTQISIRLTDTVPSTFTNELLSCVVNEKFYYPVEPVTINCTEYGRPGEFIEFNFSGKMSLDSVGPALPFSGAIRARREY